MGKPVLTLALAASLAIAPGAANSASPNSLSYTALSKTARSITGNLRLEESAGLVRRIVFHNGKSLVLTGSGRDGVYMVSPPADPAMLGGNHLCGGGMKATRVALTWGIHGAFSMSVYSGKSITDVALCGTFDYTNP